MYSIHTTAENLKIVLLADIVLGIVKKNRYLIVLDKKNTLLLNNNS